jgi:UTP pyrophosphatase
MPPLKYLSAYPAHLQSQVRELIDQGRLGDVLRKRYPSAHDVRTDRALYEYVSELKSRHLRNAAPINKVLYDSSLGLTAKALGTHTSVSRVQGAKLKARHEIRVATLFRDAAPEFLRMIVVHELAHLKEREHDKAFYQLCVHMEPQYHQYEFDLRLHLTQLDLDSAERTA